MNPIYERSDVVVAPVCSPSTREAESDRPVSANEQVPGQRENLPRNMRWWCLTNTTQGCLLTSTACTHSCKHACIHTYARPHAHTQTHQEMASIWGDRYANCLDLIMPQKHISKHGIHELYNNYLSWVIDFSAHIPTQSIQNYLSKIIYSVSSCARVFYFLESGVGHRPQCRWHWRAGERA